MDIKLANALNKAIRNAGFHSGLVTDFRPEHGVSTVAVSVRSLEVLLIVLLRDPYAASDSGESLAEFTEYSQVNHIPFGVDILVY